MKPYKKDLGEVIRKLRKENKLTQEELSKRSGISRVYINQIESGRSKQPSAMVLYWICVSLNKSMDDLMYYLTTKE